MRLISAFLSVVTLSGVAMAQAPNAVGIWRTDCFGPNDTAVFVGPVTALALPSWSAWACLPPDVLTYFKPQSSATPGARTLDFRGWEVYVYTPANTTAAAKAYRVPACQLKKAVQAPAPNEGRLLPDSSATVYFTSAAITLNVAAGGGASVWRVQMMTATPVSVPAGSSAGEGLAFVWPFYMYQFGSTAAAPNSTTLMFTTNESGPTTQAYSGFTDPTGANFWVNIGALSAEACVTFFFEQSMIGPMKNASQIAPGGIIPGGTLPAAVTFGFQGDDGRGALSTIPGDVISYTVNSNKMGVLGPAGAGNVWIVPFTLYEGDVTSPGVLDPNPENWVANGGGAENSYIYPMPFQRWLDDVLLAFGAIEPNAGLKLNPNNSTQGVWLGIDSAPPLPYTPPLFNASVIINAFQFADTSAPGFSGPETIAYDSVTQPAAVFGRNLTTFGTRTGEFRTLLNPQRGFTCVFPQGASFGFGTHPGGPVVGQSFYITAWVIDLASPTNPTGVNLIDMTNVVRIQL